MSNTYKHKYLRRYHRGLVSWEECCRAAYGGNERWWLYSEPKWWRKMCKHKRRRQATRKALHDVMVDTQTVIPCPKGEGISAEEVIYSGCDELFISDRGEDVIFPLDKKPWIYYY